MRVHVALTPADASGLALDGWAAVAVDVLRATTTVVAACAAGCARIIPVTDSGAARERAALFAAGEGGMAGERGGEPIPGFHLGNSPLEFTPERVRGRTILLTTTNGTAAMPGAGTARARALAPLTHLSALARGPAAAAPGPPRGWSEKPPGEVMDAVRAPAPPAQPPDGSPRTAGPQPRDVLRLDSPDSSPRTAGPQPRDVLRLALRPGGRFGRGAKPPSQLGDGSRADRPGTAERPPVRRRVQPHGGGPDLDLRGHAGRQLRPRRHDGLGHVPGLPLLDAPRPRPLPILCPVRRRAVRPRVRRPARARQPDHRRPAP